MSEGELILYSTEDGAATNRRVAEALAADEADVAQLEEMEKAAKGRKKGGGDA